MLLYGVAKEHGSLVTLRELHSLLAEEGTEEELAEAISTIPALSAKFELKSGYLTERNAETVGERTVDYELINRRSAETNLRWAARFVPHLRSASFRLVGASGSTSYRSASKSRDLDLFCVAPTGKLWTTLTSALILARAFRLLHPRSPEICFSCMMDEEFASILFRREQGPLFARDALETVVLEGEPTYRWLLGEAKWISNFYPNAYYAKVGVGPTRRAGNKRPSLASRVLERFLFLFVGTHIRRKARTLNGRLAERGELDSTFGVRCDSDHLIYESRRYSKLKQAYSSNLSSVAQKSESTPGPSPQVGGRAPPMQRQDTDLTQDGTQRAEEPLARPSNVDAEFIRFSTRGRVTGLPHIVQLRFAWRDGSFNVVSGGTRSDWVLNAVGRRRGVVRLGELLYEVSVEQVHGQELMRILERFRSKYGGRVVDRWYAGAGTALRLTPLASPVRRGSASGESDTKSSLAQWREERKDYYGDVAAAFDSASEEYDYTIGHNFINTWIRRRSIQVLMRRVRPDDFLVEIGAGTGAEAIEIAKHVRGLLAIDISQSMVDLMAAKVKARHLEGKVLPIRLAASELREVRSLLKEKKVRVAYSFNGALNCEPRIGEFVTGLADLLEPDGIFVCSVRNTLCMSEALSHAAVFQFDRMSPRKRQPIMVSVGGKDIPSTYYSPHDFAAKFKPYFKVKEAIALPGLLPPAYLNDYYLKLGGMSSVIEHLDRALSGLFPLNRYGDQTLFVFRRSS